MAAVKPIASAVLGLLLLVSIVGYSGSNEVTEIPEPQAGACGVTEEAFSDVPGSGAILDIDVNIAWDNSNVWIGIIDVETFESLQKSPAVKGGMIVSNDCQTIQYIAGGPDYANETSFDMIPDGEPFHIMIGQPDNGGGDDDDDDDDDDPWPWNNDVNSQGWTDNSFDVDVDYDVSGGWGSILILFLGELVLAYLIWGERN